MRLTKYIKCTTTRTERVLNPTTTRNRSTPQHTHIYTRTPPHSLLTLHTLLLHGDRLGQIARTVHVAALEDSHVVGEELEGDDGKESL